jgi:hypothetical protein
MKISAVARALIIVMLTLPISTKPLGERNSSPKKDAMRFSIRQQRTIQLHPSGIKFQVPLDWLKWNSRFHNNLHLTKEELRKVQVGKGEWDSEYSLVVNATLPFEDCAAHVGGEGWGLESGSYGDLQMRAYVTDLSIREILERIQGPAFDEAKRIAKSEGGRTGSEAHISVSSDRDWQRATIVYPLWYHDYGGTAMIDFYLRDASPYRLVLVFMGGEGRPDEKPAILESVLLAEK